MVKGLQSPPEGDVWTTHEVATWLKCCDRTVLRWIAQGKLYAHDCGRFYRIPRHSVYKMLAEKHEAKVRKQKQSKTAVSNFT